MVESIGNELLANAECECSLNGIGSEVAVMDNEIPSNEVEMLSTEGKDSIETCPRVDQYLRVESVQLDLTLSDKSSNTVGVESGNVGTEDTLKGGSEVLQGNDVLCSSVHNQVENVSGSIFVSDGPITVEVSDVQIVKADDSLNGNSSHVEKKLIDHKTGHETVEGNGKVASADSQKERVGSANPQIDSKSTDDIITDGQVSEAGTSVADLKVDAGFPFGHEGSVQVSSAESFSYSASEAIVGCDRTHVSASLTSRSDPAPSCAYTVASETHQSNDVDVQVGADTSFAVEVQEQANDPVSLCDGDFAKPKSEQSEDAGEHIQSDVGIGVESQEHARGQVFSYVGDSLAPTSSHDNNAYAETGSNLEGSRGVHEQANDPNSSCVADFVASEPEDSGEAAEPIRSYVPSGIGVQDHAYDAEMVDPDLQEGEEGPVSDDDKSHDTEDDKQRGSGVGVKVGLNDSAAVSVYDEENMDDELVADVWDSRSQYEPVDDVGISQDEEKNAKCVASRSGALVKEYHASYDLPPENSYEFSVSDLVWGKVKSHPWWPGQIFHPSDSSEKAMKYYRKDCYLVAYFGDRSFAWNDASLLRPFRAHFSQEENQSSSESFQNAVNCALEEVSRRVNVGLACSCLPEDAYEKIRFQTVQNAGIKKEASKREGGDRYASVDSFQPNNIFQFVRRLAQLPTSGASRLELAIVKAHLSSFYRLKGHYSLPEFQLHKGLLENDVDPSLPPECRTEQADSFVTDVSGAGRSKASLKRKHNLKDIVYHRRKEKSFSDLMGESMFYYDEDYDSDEKYNDMLGLPIAGRERRANFLADDFTVQDSTQTISLAKVSQSMNPSPRQSFKIGDCIRRVASQLTGAPSLTGSPSTPKPSGDGNDKLHSGDDLYNSFETPEETKSGEMVVATEETSPDQFLLQLWLTAQGPMKVYSFSRSTISFFSEFRDSVASARHSSKENSSVRKGVFGRRRKTSLAAGGLPETFEFEERSDSYWTDMVVQHDSEDKPQRRGRKRKEHNQVATGEQEKPVKSRRKYSRKQYESPAEKFCEDEMKKEQLQLDTELILSFSDIVCVPSEINLNKMFKRFGPLKESETRVDRETSHARVIFKRGSDAEVAYSSAATFNIFGPSTVVNYQLNYTPSVPLETSPLALTNYSEGAT